MSRVSQILRGHGNGPVDASAALLERFEGDELGNQVDPARGKLHHFTDPALCGMQGIAEGTHWPGRGLGGLQEGGALLGCEVEPAALGIEKLFGLSAHCYRLVSYCNRPSRNPQETRV